MSDRSNSNDSLHGALVTPVISRSTATKSASPTRRRRSPRADSKFDLVTFFRANVEVVVVVVDVVVVVEEEQRERVNGARVRVLESALTDIHCFFFMF